MAGNSREAGRSVLSRAFSLLQAFDEASLRLSLTEIAARSAQPLSTAHRLCGELVDLGVLARGTDGRFEVGLAAFRLGVLAPAYAEVRRAALPHLSDLSAQTGENAQLAVLDGDGVIYLERIVGRRSVPLVSFPGSRLPLHSTGVGKALLATLPDDVVRRYLAGRLERFTPHTITAPGKLLREITAIRERGFAFTKEEMSLGSFSVAQALAVRPGGAQFAVGVTVRRIVRTPATVAARLRKVAADIDAAIPVSGSQPPER